jgi:hypothetical protein
VEVGLLGFESDIFEQRVCARGGPGTSFLVGLALDFPPMWIINAIQFLLLALTHNSVPFSV